MKTAAPILLTIIAVLCPVAAGAQESAREPAQPAMTMSESDAVRAALDASPELTRLNKRVEARQAGAQAARFDVRNPELRVQDLSTQYFKPSANHRFQIGMRWHLPRYGEVDETVALARWEYQDARVDAFEYRMKIIGEARLAYFDVVALRDELDLAARREAVEARRLEVVSRLLDLGTVPFVRKMKAQTALLRARRDLAAMRNALAASRARLASLVGNDSPVDAGDFELPDGEIDMAAALRLAESRRPEVDLERERTELARAARRAEVLNMIPSFSFVEASFHHETKDTDWGELMFGIEIPVFNWGRGKLNAAEMSAEARESTPSAGMDVIKKDIADAFRQAAEARAGYLALKEQTDETRENVRKMTAQARQQGIPEDEVLELELSELELDEMLLSARRDYAESLIELCVAVGVDDFAGLAGD